jgi:hypothetical protein
MCARLGLGSEAEEGMYKYIPSTYKYKHSIYWGRTQYSYAPGHAPGISTYQVHACTTKVHTQYILVCTEYVLSTYSVQGYACCIPRLQRCSDVTVLLISLLQSTNSVHTWYGTVLQLYVLRYRTKPLVLVCSCTYLLVMHVTIQEKLKFWFGTWYIWICTTFRVVLSGCTKYQIKMSISPESWHALQGGTYATDQYKWFHMIPGYVPLLHCANWVRTCLYFKLQFQNFHKYVPVCTWHVLVHTRKNQKWMRIAW